MTEATETSPATRVTTVRPVPWWQAGLVFVLLSGLYAAVSFQQYNRMDSFVFDLGFFESVVRDYAHGHLPRLQVTDTATAALHFSPILALLAPLVLLVSSPLTLLGVQALAVAAGVIPLMRAAGAGWIAWVVAISYGLAPGFGALIGYDFHEVALGVPLLSLSLAAMLRSDHRAAVLWALPLLLVKEDLGLTVAALGFVVFLRGSRRWGVVAMVVGAVAFLAIQWWVLPAWNGDTAGFADKYAPAGPADALRVLFDGVGQKWRTVLFLLLPTGLLALRSPMLLIVALPTYGWRFVSARQTYWEPWYQYEAILVPIAVAAMIEGARLLHGRFRDAGLGLAVVGTLLLVPQQALSQAWHADFWRTPARTAAIDQVLDKIPSGSRVAASDDLGGRIALRAELYLIGDTLAPDGPPAPASEFDGVQWVAFDRELPLAQTTAWKGFAALVDSGEFEVVAEADGVVIARRVGE
ncbi:MAG: hypothetical protein JWR90_1959 [Marmoricola sp.]|nr:hypothetical protein [Marmoricola sp.]